MSVVRFRPWAPIISFENNNIQSIAVINVGIVAGILRELPIDLLVSFHLGASELCIQPGVVKIGYLVHGSFRLAQLLVRCIIASRQITILQ